jgi:hypothetical protein
MDKVTYSSDTTAAVPGAALSAARYYLAATGNSTAGYFGGGDPGPRSTMDKVTYASDTTAAVPGAALSVARYLLPQQETQQQDTLVVVFLVQDQQWIRSLIHQIPQQQFLVQLSAARYGLAATGNSTAGYFGGGGPGPKTTMDKVTYSSDTTAAVPGAALSVARYNLPQQETQQQDTLVVVNLVQEQQWIRSLMHLIPQQQFLVQH